MRRIIEGGRVEVVVTKHAVERLIERRLGSSWRTDLTSLLDIIRNVVRDGYYRPFTERLLIWTRRYVLICCIDRYMRINVLTVLSKESLRDEMRRLLRGGARVRWREISLKPPKVSIGGGGPS